METSSGKNKDSGKNSNEPFTLHEHFKEVLLDLQGHENYVFH